MDKTAWGLASFLWSCAWAVCALAGAVASLGTSRGGTGDSILVAVPGSVGCS